MRTPSEIWPSKQHRNIPDCAPEYITESRGPYKQTRLPRLVTSWDTISIVVIELHPPVNPSAIAFIISGSSAHVDTRSSRYQIIRHERMEIYERTSMEPP